MSFERVEIGNAVLYRGDCLEILPTLQAVDAVVTDPPFEDEAHAAGRRVLSKGRALGRARFVDPSPLPFAAISDDLRATFAAWAAANCNGWALAFCQAEAVSSWRSAFEKSGAAWRRAMVWVKPDSAPQLSGDRPAQGYESIAAAWCGGGRSWWSGGGRRGVFVHPKHDSGFGHGGMANWHPTQKPMLLMRDLVSLFSGAGATVLDPFMGSGSTGVACAQLGRRFIGIEIEPRYFNIACRRIEQAQAQGKLFDSGSREPHTQAVLFGEQA